MSQQRQPQQPAGQPYAAGQQEIPSQGAPPSGQAGGMPPGMYAPDGYEEVPLLPNRLGAAAFIVSLVAVLALFLGSLWTVSADKGRKPREHSSESVGVIITVVLQFTVAMALLSLGLGIGALSLRNHKTGFGTAGVVISSCLLLVIVMMMTSGG